MTRPLERVRNGVDTEQMFGTLDAIKAEPDLARFRFRARNRWISGAHNRSTIKEFYGAGQEDASRAEPFVMDADEPPIVDDRDRPFGDPPPERLHRAAEDSAGVGKREQPQLPDRVSLRHRRNCPGQSGRRPTPPAPRNEPAAGQTRSARDAEEALAVPAG